MRFPRDPDVTFSSKLAEGDVRMTRPRRKISGGFRTAEEAADFAAIRSFISMARKRGWNLIQAPGKNPDGIVRNPRLA